MRPVPGALEEPPGRLREGVRAEVGLEPDGLEGEPEPEFGSTLSTSFCTEGSFRSPPLLDGLDPEGELEPEEGVDEPEGSLVLGTVTLVLGTDGVVTDGVLTVGVEAVGVVTLVPGTCVLGT
jgi:hypothetical protein